MTDEREPELDFDAPAGATPPTRPTPGAEGVRIIGAEEARAAIDSGNVQPRIAPDEPKFGDVPPRPPAPPTTRTVRFPLPDDLVNETPVDEIVLDEDAGQPRSAHPQHPAQGPGSVRPISTAASAAPEPQTPAAAPTVRLVRPVTPPDTETSGPVEMPHWTEPPTGEVPRILPDAETAINADADLDLDIEEAIIEDDDENLQAWASLASAPRFRDSAGDWEGEDFATTTGGDLKDDTMQVGALAADLDDDAEFEREVAARRRVRGGGSGGGGGRRRPRTEAAAAATTEPSGRNLPIAVATGVAIACIAIASMFMGPAWVCALAVVIIVMAAIEFFEGLRRASHQPATLLALLGSATLVIATYNRGTAAFPIVFALVVFFTMLWYLLEVVHARPVANIGVTLLGFMYIGFFGSFAALILAMPWQTTADIGANDGVGIILGLAICAVGSDVVAYFVGSKFGRTRIAPRVSPHKTLEGLLGGFIASVALALMFAHLFQPWSTSWGATLALGALVGVIAPIGDLIESMLKRDLGVKDFGTLLPGHGGVLDRFDGILVCLPAVYFLARAFFG